ncbi:hypothetical protein phytr_3890 [Candidatus Phycorickettsia trachydisci]|uniref:ATP synthase YMF19-like N-terminal domain-containing protein n=1 Tax=Candidatus Phycorickettsia trachydisci TaxID=2115978 RepID=A0A2P1P7T9_9RICK|nr:hypothetical protein [Candidatus Phycorickettsia trachydisci]AVP87340.1 hypothetical protein phytr_3890 [Candidatus Phycorickettsia trachydisci]
MPQLDVSSYLSQIFWLTISFCLIYGFLAYNFIPRLKEAFKMRDGEVERLIREAKNLHEQAKSQEEEYQIQSKDLQAQLIKIQKENQDQCKQYLDSQMDMLRDIFDARKNELLISLDQVQKSIDDTMESFVSKASQILVKKIKSEETPSQSNRSSQP